MHKHNNTFSLSSWLLIGLMVSAGPALAASDGTLDATSASTTTLTLSKGEGLRISDIDDVAFGVVTDQPVNHYEDVCIYSTTGTYTVTASSDHGTGTTFRLQGQSTSEFLEYDLEWTSDTAATSGENLNHANVSATQADAHTSDPDCGGVPTARLIVDVDNDAFDAAASDTYVDTLTLTIEPD